MIPDAFCSYLCVIAPILFAFAAGCISYRPASAHVLALAGLVSLPWIYWATLKDTPLGNIWTLFNVPDRERLTRNLLDFTELTIISIALVLLAIATAALRLLPSGWKLRGLAIRERTWPALAAMLLFLGVWFSKSVMPYRISGAVDYAGWPILQILHVEKRGLQFHETCVKIAGYRGHPESVRLSWNDRRLFQYRFQQNEAWGEVPPSVLERTRAVMQSLDSGGAPSDPVKPLRAWNIDGWYVMGESVGLKVYESDKKETPPREIVELFNELAKVSRVRQTQSDMRDICLGFCYDPLSGLGLLYANHRCRYDSVRSDYVCR